MREVVAARVSYPEDPPPISYRRPVSAPIPPPTRRIDVPTSPDTSIASIDADTSRGTTVLTIARFMARRMRRRSGPPFTAANPPPVPAPAPLTASGYQFASKSTRASDSTSSRVYQWTDAGRGLVGRGGGEGSAGAQLSAAVGRLSIRATDPPYRVIRSIVMTPTMVATCISRALTFFRDVIHLVDGTNAKAAIKLHNKTNAETREIWERMGDSRLRPLCGVFGSGEPDNLTASEMHFLARSWNFTARRARSDRIARSEHGVLDHRKVLAVDLVTRIAYALGCYGGLSTPSLTSWLLDVIAESAEIPDDSSMPIRIAMGEAADMLRAQLQDLVEVLK